MTLINTTVINESAFKNIEFAFEAGLHVPRLAYLNSIKPDEAEKIIADPTWYIPENSTIAMKYVGEPLSVVCMWDGDRIAKNVLCINSQSLLNNGQGVDLDANAITIFENKDDVAQWSLKHLAKYLRVNQVEPTYILLDLVLDKNSEVFKKINFGIPDDVLLLLMYFYNSTTPEQIPLATDTVDNFCASLRLWAYPYNVDVNKKVVDLIEHETMILGDIDDCYCVMSHGRRVHEAWDNLYRSIPKTALRSGVCYKTDGGKEAKDIFFKLKSHGVVCKRRSEA